MAATSSSSASRIAGPIQGWVLVSCAWLAVMANQTISSILPRMQSVFAAVPDVAQLMALVATGPALFVAVLSVPAGFLGDRFGHRRVLFLSTLLYGVVGTAPLWLNSLPQIVLSRALVGVAEAAVMTCSTALIGDYFIGASRERYLALQTGTAPLVAITVTALGGALGNNNWRFPFFVYGFAFVLIPLTGLMLWEGRRGSEREGALAATAGHAGNARQAADMADAPTKARWGMLVWTCLVTVFGMMAFLVTAIQTGYLLSERGLDAPKLIGFWSSLAMLANPTGAVIFSLLRWQSVSKLALSFTLLSIGHALMALLPGWQSAVMGAAVANLGAGMILPTLITWALRSLPAEQRGRGTGLWMSASFLGQFLSPQSILLLEKFTGTLSSSILVYAIASGLCAFVALVFALRPARALPVMA